MAKQTPCPSMSQCGKEQAVKMQSSKDLSTSYFFVKSSEGKEDWSKMIDLKLLIVKWMKPMF